MNSGKSCTHTHASCVFVSVCGKTGFCINGFDSQYDGQTLTQPTGVKMVRTGRSPTMYRLEATPGARSTEGWWSFCVLLDYATLGEIQNYGNSTEHQGPTSNTSANTTTPVYTTMSCVQLHSMLRCTPPLHLETHAASGSHFGAKLSQCQRRTPHDIPPKNLFGAV